MGFLDIKSATKSYGAVKILHETNISIEEGEFLVLVGPSGCGKSTLLNMIAGLEDVTSGEIAIKGRSMVGVRPADRNIAMVFQSYALYPNMNVGQNIVFGLEMHGVPKPERDKAMNEVAELLQIKHLLDRKPGQLSGGQRQRVAMGRALVRDPDVFLFDEPLSNLDAKLRVDMRTEIKKLHQKLKTTIVYVTHDQIEALTLSTRIAVMFGGHVQQLGTPKEIYDNPANIFVAGFMGSPSMNLFPAKIAVENGHPVAKALLAGGGEATLPFAEGRGFERHAGRDIVLGLRPEAITDRDGADRHSKAVHVVEAPVEVTEPAGSDTFVVTHLGGKEVTGRFRADVDVQPGQSFPFAINMEKAVAFDPKTEMRIFVMRDGPDIVIIGSGIGGGTMAAALAASGRRIVILERGERLADCPEARDDRAIFERGHFRPDETWFTPEGEAFNPGNYYYVGGNSKLYGAVLIRYRAEDFRPIRHLGGTTPGWPISYDDLEPWYQAAEELYGVHGDTEQDPTEPRHSGRYPFQPVPDEPGIAAVRARLRMAGVTPSSLPLGIDLDGWLKRAATPWDAFPDTTGAKRDGETVGIAKALEHPNVTLETGALVTRLLGDADGRITAVEYSKNGEARRLSAGTVVLAAGAVNSAVLLLRSGLANRSDQVGRNFMNHNCSAVMAVHPFRRNDAVYQKTFLVNDFYLTGGPDGAPLGNMQLLGKVSGGILAAAGGVPGPVAGWLAGHAVDFYAMSEDLPDPRSRVTVDGERIVLDWRRSNWEAHAALVAKLKAVLKRAGFPLVLSKPFDRRTPSHQCGTARMGTDPGTSVVDTFCRAHDHPNLFVVDASFLPTSAAVNPALTIAAQALRTADHIIRKDLAA